jgi:hypothetical protein
MAQNAQRLPRHTLGMALNSRFRLTGEVTMAKKSVKKTADAGKEPKGTIGSITSAVEEEMNEFVQDVSVANDLTDKERRRLIGPGVRNYGFIDKAFDIARDNMSLMPDYIYPPTMMTELHKFEQVRQLVFILESFLRIATDSMLVMGDQLFRDALRVYGTLREQSRANVPGTRELYLALLKFFRKRKPGGTEPTEKELERDFHNLLKGHADGELLIENEMPKMTGGSRKVVDNVRKGKAAVKETAEASEKNL